MSDWIKGCGVRLKSAGWDACGEPATHVRVGPYGGVLPLCERHTLDAKTVYPNSQIKPVARPSCVEQEAEKGQ